MSPSTVLVVNLIAIVPIGVLGSLLHFVFEWSGRNRAVAIFATVNESTWEHLKIAFWPVFVFFVAQFALGGWALPGFVPAITVALFSLPVTIVALVLAYTSVTGRNILWIDIAIFFLAIAVSLTIAALLATELTASRWTVALSVPFLLALVVAFATFTLAPPELDLFVDPRTGEVGIAGHRDLRMVDVGIAAHHKPGVLAGAGAP